MTIILQLQAVLNSLKMLYLLIMPENLQILLKDLKRRFIRRSVRARV